MSRKTIPTIVLGEGKLMIGEHLHEDGQCGICFAPADKEAAIGTHEDLDSPVPATEIGAFLAITSPNSRGLTVLSVAAANARDRLLESEYGIGVDYSYEDVVHSCETLFTEIFGRAPNSPISHVLPVTLKDVLLECLLDERKYFQPPWLEHTQLVRRAYAQLKECGYVGMRGE